MNNKIIYDYIKQYKERFEEISLKEIYKWKAVKHFQKHWDIEADDFPAMLTESLSKTKNLLASGNYLPRQMVQTFAQTDPEEVRELFRVLFNQNEDLKKRFIDFKTGFAQLAQNRLQPEKDNHYQDARARMVYLSLKHPEKHYLYKFGMFRDFSKLIDYRYQPQKGKFANVVQFEKLCEDLKAILIKDDELLKLHHDRLGNDCYQDPAHNILTQDFIYACARHLQHLDIPKEIEVDVRFETGNFEDYNVLQSNPLLIGSTTDYGLKQSNNTRLGRAGEDFVLDLEKKKLKQLGITEINKKLKHSSVEEGDGLGYDIKSVDEMGNEIFIEVKATTGGFGTPFYITRHELYCSEENSAKYRLYRLYHFDPIKNKGKIKIFSGDLSSFCVQASNYKVSLTEKTT